MLRSFRSTFLEPFFILVLTLHYVNEVQALIPGVGTHCSENLRAEQVKFAL